MRGLQAAAREAFATSPSNVAYVEALEFYHESFPSGVRIVKALTPQTLRLETGAWVEFEAAAFSIILPAANPDGLQEMQLAVDNVDRRLKDFLKESLNFITPVSVFYRYYLSTDLGTPQLNPPLELSLSDVKVGTFQITARASMADLINKNFPSEMYYRSRFPGIGH